VAHSSNDRWLPVQVLGYVGVKELELWPNKWGLVTLFQGF